MREAALHAIQVLLNDVETHLKEPKFVRWLSHAKVIKAFVNCFASMTAAFSREASQRKDPAAKAYLNSISNVHPVASLLICFVICYPMSKLNFSDLQPAIDTALGSVDQLRITITTGQNGQSLEELLTFANITVQDLAGKTRRWNNTVREPYFEALCRCARDRFPVMSLLAVLSIFDPVAINEMSGKELSTFGQDKLETLLGVLGQPHEVIFFAEGLEKVDVDTVVKPIVDLQDTREEWIHVKSKIRSHSSLVKCQTSVDLTTKLQQYHSSDFSNLLTIAD